MAIKVWLHIPQISRSETSLSDTIKCEPGLKSKHTIFSFVYKLLESSVLDFIYIYIYIYMYIYQALCSALDTTQGQFFKQSIWFFFLSNQLLFQGPRAQYTLLFTYNQRENRRINTFSGISASWKKYQPRPGFELRLPYSLSTTIAITPRAFYFKNLL